MATWFFWFSLGAPLLSPACSVDEFAESFLNSSPPFDAHRIITVRLKRGLKNAEEELASLGLKVHSVNRTRLEVIGELDAERLLALSRDPRISEIVQGQPTGELKVFRNGRSWYRAPPVKPSGQDYETVVWSSMPPLEKQTPPTPAQIRKAASRDVTIVLGENAPASARERRNREALYGAHIFYAEDLAPGDSVVTLPGLVLQLGDTPNVFRVRGEANPILGAGPDRVILNKTTEMAWLSQNAPTQVPKTYSGRDVVSRVPNFRARSRELRLEINAYLRGDQRSLSISVRRKLETLATDVIRASQELLGGDVVIKHAHARSSGDYHDVLTTPATDGSGLVSEALDYFLDLRRNSKGKATLDSAAYAKTLEALESPQSPFLLRALLIDPTEMLFQQKVQIRKIDGQEVEFRVDVVGGQIVQSRLRYGFEVLPAEQRQAVSEVSRFLKSLTAKEAAEFSGGVDICQLEDGSFKILETNAGNESGFLYAYLDPVAANMALSTLTGKPTPLVQALQTVVTESLSEQAAFLQTFPKRWRAEYTTYRQVPRQELFYRIVHLRLESLKAGDRAAGRAIVRDLQKLADLAGLSDDRVTQQILESTKRAISE